jgi:hypothetical protein
LEREVVFESDLVRPWFDKKTNCTIRYSRFGQIMVERIPKEKEEARMTINVTQTQKLVAEAALSAIGANEMLRDPANIDTLVRAMLVIEGAHMQAYMLRGFNWSCMSRNRREPLEVARDRAELDQSVEWFHQSIDQARGEPARRIRGNRARRLKEMVREAEHLQQYAGQQLRELKMWRRGIFNLDAANWDGAPHQQRVGRPDEDAA